MFMLCICVTLFIATITDASNDDTPMDDKVTMDYCSITPRHQ